MKTGAVKVSLSDKAKAVISFDEKPLLTLSKEEVAELQRQLTKLWKEMI